MPAVAISVQLQNILSVICNFWHPDAQSRASECPDVKNYKSRLNPVWHRMLYSCTHMATAGVRGLKEIFICTTFNGMSPDCVLATEQCLGLDVRQLLLLAVSGERYEKDTATAGLQRRHAMIHARLVANHSTAHWIHHLLIISTVLAQKHFEHNALHAAVFFWMCQLMTWCKMQFFLKLL